MKNRLRSSHSCSDLAPCGFMELPRGVVSSSSLADSVGLIQDTSPHLS